MTVWLNDAFERDDAPVSAQDRGLLIGDGAFETLYVDNGVAAFIDAHLSRLRLGLDLLRIAPPSALGETARIIAALYEKDGHAGPVAARLTVTRGDGPRGLRMTACGPATMLVALAAPPAVRSSPLTLHIAAHRRFAGAATNGFKATGAYLQNMLAHEEACAAGADEALMLNEHGRLASAAAANIFVLKGARALTPPPAEGAMPGIVRKVVLEEGARAGLIVEERPIAPEELAGAELFVTNALIGVAPARLAGMAGGGGEMTARLRSCYQRRLAAELAGK